MVANYSYDGAGQLTAINQTNGANTIFSAAYTLDNRGNRTAIAENINGVTRTLSYSYDELNRLTSESQKLGAAQSTVSTYSYLPNGNRSQLITTLPSSNIKGASGPLVMTTTYSYNSADWLTSRQDASSSTPFNAYTYNYGYDLNGSLTSQTSAASGGETVIYSYDTRNRLVGVQNQAKSTNLTTASFTYDGNDTRTSMTYISRTTSYLQDVNGFVPVALQEIVIGQGASGVPSSFLFQPGSTSPLFQTDPTGAKLWYHSDGLGSVRALTGNAGNVLNAYSYTAFGTNTSSGNTTVNKASNDHLYAGEQLDPTGLYYNRARYYSPSIGRFTERDTQEGLLGDTTDVNRYSYAHNNSLTYTDSSGYSVYMDKTELGIFLDGDFKNFRGVVDFIKTALGGLDAGISGKSLIEILKNLAKGVGVKAMPPFQPITTTEAISNEVEAIFISNALSLFVNLAVEQI